MEKTVEHGREGAVPISSKSSAAVAGNFTHAQMVADEQGHRGEQALWSRRGPSILAHRFSPGLAAFQDIVFRSPTFPFSR